VLAVVGGLVGALIGVLIVGPGAGAASAAPSGTAASAGSAGSIATASARSAAAACHPFKDVAATNTHCANIAWLKTQRITREAGGRFHPTSRVTRGSMAAFLFRLTHPGESQPSCAGRPFPDVPTSHAFCGYIRWADDGGITHGYSDGTYRPGRPVTRGAMAAFLNRVVTAGASTPRCTQPPFFDVGVHDTFCGAITWMRRARVTRGFDEGITYRSARPVSRQAMATFLHRLDVLLSRGSLSSCRPAKKVAQPAVSASDGASPAASPYALGPVQPRTALVADIIGRRFGIRTMYGWRPPSSEKYDPNGHPAGMAVDFMIDDLPHGTAVGHKLAAYLQRNQTWISIAYVIYRQHIWIAGQPFDDWRKMEDRGSPTQNHMNHVHLSLVAVGGDRSGTCRA
jgi:hypothetical protein